MTLLPSLWEALPFAGILISIALLPLAAPHFWHRRYPVVAALWGLAFKPDTDDIREASSLSAIEALLGANAKIRAYDPIAVENVRKSMPAAALEKGQIVFCSEQYEALDGADALLLVTEWKQFRNPDFDRIKRRLRTPMIFDGRNQYDPKDLAEQGFEYYGIGRGRGAAEASESGAEKAA